jgi:glycosyltransferase involved in cell wall biosynthesis
VISVCVATYNGEKFIDEQLKSILLSPLVSEVIVSDDGSTDATVARVRAIDDSRVKLVEGPGKGIVCNFESLLTLAQGEYIFLADQDDLWMPNKVEVMMSSLNKADLVVCDCTVVDAKLRLLHPSFFEELGEASSIYF